MAYKSYIFDNQFNHKPTTSAGCMNNQHIYNYNIPQQVYAQGRKENTIKWAADVWNKAL